MTAALSSVCSRPIPGLEDCPARTVIFSAPADADAEETRTGPMTWAQQHMLMLMEELAPRTESVNLKFSFPLRIGAREEDVFDAVRDLVETFDALRTVYVPPPDGPAQRVLRSGELTVPVVVAEKGKSVAAAARVADDMWAEPFDPAGEWPIRVALVTADGRPRHLVIAACHLVIDQTGGTWMEYHLRRVLAKPPAEVRLPDRRHQPLDEAEWERSAVGGRHAERALALHARTLRAMPRTMLPRTMPPRTMPPRPPALGQAAPEDESPRYRFLQFDSVALALAAATLARRHNVSPAAVLYAGSCAVSGFVSSLDRAFLQLTVGNRIAARTRFAVGMHTQDVPAYVDLAGATLSDVIEQAGVAVTEAARFGQYPPADLAATRRAIELDRGIVFDLSCRLNYRTVGTRRTPGDSVGTQRAPGDSVGIIGSRSLADAAGRTRWRWAGGVDSSTSTYFVMADDAGDMMRLSVLVDTAVLPPDEAVGRLRAVERLLCAATTTEIPTSRIGDHTELTPTPRTPEWCLTEAGWAHVPAVADLVRRTAGVTRADVFAAPGQDGRRLLAYLDGMNAAIDIARLHAACVDALPGLRTAVAPHNYVVCAGAPSASDRGAWQFRPVLAEGTGRPE